MPDVLTLTRQTLFGATAAATFIEDLNTNKSAQVEAYSTNKYVQAG